MIEEDLTAPSEDELEVTVFGPGVGEAIAVHLGGGKWILIDSCRNSETYQPVSLEYLEQIGIDYSAVELIVATHWHNDHIRGFSDIVSSCQAAKVSISLALSTKEFMTLGLAKSRMTTVATGVDELVRLYRVLADRRARDERFNPPIYAKSSLSLHWGDIQVSEGAMSFEVTALSPSDASIEQALLAIRQLLGDDEQFMSSSVASPKPNHASVALWLEIGPHRILLGADLEETRRRNTGWAAVVDGSVRIAEKADVFKVPHHGSKTGHNDKVWSRLLMDNPIAVITPYRALADPLPTASDIERILSFTPHAYLTNSPELRKTKYRDSAVAKTIRRSGKELRKIEYGMGMVQLRKPIGKVDEPWKIILGKGTEQLSVFDR